MIWRQVGVSNIRPRDAIGVDVLVQRGKWRCSSEDWSESDDLFDGFWGLLLDAHRVS